MKDYIIHAESREGFTGKVQTDVQKILDQTGGKIVSVSEDRFVRVVASENAIEQIMALDAVTGMSEFIWSADGTMKQYSIGTVGKIDNELRDSIEKVLNATGGKVIREGIAGYSILVEASEAAAAKLEKLKGVDFVEENKRSTLKNWHLTPISANFAAVNTRKTIARPITRQRFAI